jgi:Flp pilus assembly protein TadG
MKRLYVLMLLVGLFFAGVSVQATKCSLSRAKSVCAKKASKCAKLTPAQKAAKYKKYAENYKKLAAKMTAKGNTKKAAYYTKLAAAKSKMAKAYETNDMKALKKAQAEYKKIKECPKAKKIFKSKSCSKSCKK